MARLAWGEEGSSYVNRETGEVGVSKREVERGWASAAIAHELAHRREGIWVDRSKDTPLRVFWKELAAWEAAMERGLAPEELSLGLIEDSLGGYLYEVGGYYGKDSLEYKQCKSGYDRFRRKYLSA